MNIEQCIIIFVTSLILIVIASIIGGVLEFSELVTKESIGLQGVNVIKASYFFLFLLLAFTSVRPFLRAFTTLQTAIGHGDFAIIRFIRNNELKITYWIWGVFLLGIIIALPVAVKDWFLK